MRAPNLPTAVADVVAGGVLAGASLSSPSVFVPALGSVALYAGGVALNDAFDVEKDRIAHPDRVLPSGRMTVGAAKLVGFALLAMGVASGIPQGLPGVAVAALLAIAILAYDLLPESAGAIGAVMIGLCRALNLYRGAVAEGPWHPDIVALAVLHGALVFCIGAISLGEDRPGGRLTRVAVLVLPFLYAGPAIVAFRHAETLLAFGVLLACGELALCVVRPAHASPPAPTAVVPRGVFTLTLVGALYAVARRDWIAAAVLLGLFLASRPLARWLGQRGS